MEGSSRWYVRSAVAASLDDAAVNVIGHLRDKLKLPADNVALDHYVQEFGIDGQQRVLHSLADKPRDFQVYFDNQAWPPLAAVPFRM